MELGNTWKDYFEIVLGEKQAAQLKECLKVGTPVYFVGPQGIGKTITANTLKNLGYEASEPGQPEFSRTAGGPFYVPEKGGFKVFEMRISALKGAPNFCGMMSHPEQLKEWVKSA